MNLRRSVLLLLALFFILPAQAQKIYTYVGRVGSDSFLLAWGTTAGNGNTIGRNSVPLGKAVVEVAGRRIPSDRNWVEVNNLSPDREYPYRLLLDGRLAGEGTVRTHPAKATKLAFFVLGDYGTGKPPQYRIAEAMRQELEKRIRSDNPVRFVLTTGDNIYGDRLLGLFQTQTRDGSLDRHWGPKFFQPNEPLLKRIPFYPALGNHDVGSVLGPYLDNFFFPVAEPARYYTFSFGGLADFFALDTTGIEAGGAGDSLAPQGRQLEWLKNSLAASQSPWKIAYFHHPPFNAGPGHPASLDSLEHVVRLFAEAGVRAVFSGHEHNFQFSRQNGLTGGVLYVISGAGGNLRSGNIQAKMGRANIAGTAAQHHFLRVEIEGRALRITPLSWEPVRVRDPNGQTLPLPIVVELAEERAALPGSLPPSTGVRNRTQLWGIGPQPQSVLGTAP